MKENIPNRISPWILLPVLVLGLGTVVALANGIHQPDPYQVTVPPQYLPTMPIDVIKATAQAVITNGKNFIATQVASFHH